MSFSGASTGRAAAFGRGFCCAEEVLFNWVLMAFCLELIGESDSSELFSGEKMLLFFLLASSFAAAAAAVTLVLFTGFDVVVDDFVVVVVVLEFADFCCCVVLVGCGLLVVGDGFCWGLPAFGVTVAVLFGLAFKFLRFVGRVFDVFGSSSSSDE